MSILDDSKKTDIVTNNNNNNNNNDNNNTTNTHNSNNSNNNNGSNYHNSINNGSKINSLPFGSTHDEPQSLISNLITHRRLKPQQKQLLHNQNNNNNNWTSDSHTHSTGSDYNYDNNDYCKDYHYDNYHDDDLEQQLQQQHLLDHSAGDSLGQHSKSVRISKSHRNQLYNSSSISSSDKRDEDIGTKIDNSSNYINNNGSHTVEHKTSPQTNNNNNNNNRNINISSSKYRTRIKRETSSSLSSLSKMVTPSLNTTNGSSGLNRTTNNSRSRTVTNNSWSSYVTIIFQSVLIPIRNIIVTVLTVLLRWFIIIPIRTIQHYTFPFNDNDETSPTVTAKLAQQFLNYLKSLPPPPSSSSQPQQQLSSPTNNNNNNNSINNIGTTGNSIDWVRERNILIINGWSRYGFDTARQEAIMNQCLLLVYIHSPLHRHADIVANTLLNSKQFLDFINQNSDSNNNNRQLISIGVSIHTTQGCKLANLLRITEYPALVVLQPEREPPNVSNNSNNNNNSSTVDRSTISKIPLQLILRAESIYNLININKIISQLQILLTRHQVIVAERYMKHISRQEEIQLRKQQDDEYYATLLKDQERENQIQQERIQFEEEQKLLVQQEQERIQELQRKKQSIRPEPSIDNNKNSSNNDANNTNDTITSIRLQFSNGCKVNRKFYTNDTIDTVRTYIQLLQDDTNKKNETVNSPSTNNIPPKIGTIGLSTTFPRKSFNDDEYTNQTLDQLGLTPSAVLMVQDLDL